jgi:hypothetical protein
MSASYTFLPWVRQGLANRITASDLDPAVKLRADMDVGLTLAIHNVDGSDASQDLPARKVQLYGPGDVIGLDSRAVLRTDPRNWITNFEPNYLAAIDFYDEDLPWRYTPAAPDAAGGRLRPWITLIVLSEGEFALGAQPSTQPLPFITIKDDALTNSLPDPATLWAWAHVHVNQGITANDAQVVDNDRAAVAASLQQLLQQNADLAYSRIVCPRRLQPNKTYFAFLLPAFESGRLAGLGEDPNGAPSATACSWTSNGPDKNNFPVYYQWQFRTGQLGDFESLVRLLQPRPVDKRVGVRPMDVQQPGANLPGIEDPKLNGELQLGGALRVPRASLDPDELADALAQENWAQPYPHPFQTKLAAFINLADDYAQTSSAQANAQPGVTGIASSGDPIITPPLYGRWHAMTSRLLKDFSGNPVPNNDNWVHELNLDPRYRAAGGFGTQVVQNLQEDLMNAAWQQIGDVLEANRRLRRLQFAQQIAFTWHISDFTRIADATPGKALALTAPVQGRILSGTVTMRKQVTDSTVPPAIVASAMRRIVRPGARIMRTLSFTPQIRPDNLVERVNTRAVLPAPPKVTPPTVVTVGQLAAGLVPSGVPSWLINLLRRAPWSVYVPVMLAALLALLVWLTGSGVGLVLAILIVGVVATVVLSRIARKVQVGDSLLEQNQTPASVDALPASSDFTLTAPDPAAASITLTDGGTDNEVAARFKTGLKDLANVAQASVAADTIGENGPARTQLNLSATAEIALKALDPALTVPHLAASQIMIPRRFRTEQPEPFVEAMAYPVFDMPMYAPLSNLSSELLIPNVNFIQDNSVTLLETNQKFIESYMVGLNHEFARELLWREYPTDQRGSYFRQFWDVSSFFAGAQADDSAFREKLRDIPPLDRWLLTSKLGAHDARQRPDSNQAEVVLVIRGELLKRYPTAVIYAQAAQWQQTDGQIDPAKERTLVDIAPAEEDDPPREKIRTPLYQAKIEPDIYFFGFDLTVPQARGDSGKQPGDSAGWFFVVRERPGEPRFGFDETSSADFVVYNDLGWDHVPLSGQFIKPVGGTVPGIPNATPPGEDEKNDQRLDDVQVAWTNDVTAAELAYIMYQAPVMVAIHADEMLPAS